VSDDYPHEWTPWITHDDHSPTIDGRSIRGLRSGCPDNTGWNEHPDAYPQEWRR
jgi:hypothetical protein